MNVALFDQPQIRLQLLPFTYTRPVAEIRVGILTITEKWQHYLDEQVSFISDEYLSKKYLGPKDSNELLIINGSVCPSNELFEAINKLDFDQALSQEGTVLAAKVSSFTTLDQLLNLPTIEFSSKLCLISRPWHIFKENGEQIREDYKLLTTGRTSGLISDEHTMVYCHENIFLEEGVKIKAAILNAESGPIYLGKNSTVEEGAVIRGPFSLGEDSTVNALARMRGDITIGPKCKIGGEVSNSVLFGNSNKGHDGFLGNSVLGEWCNIGAGTNTSNLKNNYDEVKIWDYAEEKFINTGEQFCGLMMGDHSKAAIGTMLNTGTVVGVAANIFGAGFPRTLIPSFSWGGAAGFSTFKSNKVKEMATITMARRGSSFDQDEEEIINHLFDKTERYRSWEK